LNGKLLAQIDAHVGPHRANLDQLYWVIGELVHTVWISSVDINVGFAIGAALPTEVVKNQINGLIVAMEGVQRILDS
jgi:hypothetical protein